MGEQQSDKHGPQLDEELKRESEGMVRGEGPTHAEGFKETEPVETDTGEDPTAAGAWWRSGSPPGMSPRDVEERSGYARMLAGVAYPATPQTLAEHATGEGAPDEAAQRLRRLPERSYADLHDVIAELGYGQEDEDRRA